LSRRNRFTAEVSRRARRQLAKFPKDVYERLREAIDSLEEYPRPHGYEPVDECFRVRRGPYRIMYSINADDHTIFVLDVGPRDQIYGKEQRRARK
jgi:mRNA-degrading endonuclease RelE of RelBE toxin-antitoxin system